MQRETRQQRRARERRAQARGVQSRRFNWSLIAGVVVVLAVLALIVSQVLGLGKGAGTSQASDQPVDGITCGAEATAYHVHPQLTIFSRGQPVAVPQAVGTGTTGCLYWMHTHDSSGTIHVEAPSSNLTPTLGQFLDLARYTNGESVLPARKPGEPTRVYVNRKPYIGSFRAITLGRSTSVTLEFGKPFRPPPKSSGGNP